MDAEQKLTALKKAYADIILNISKEAAARVMVSERKAARFQHDLNVVKEDALRMLVRLKHMMDSKILEAETTALNQQKKIEELEAQLEEGEDIVRDLREELREVQDELERLKNEISQTPKEHINFCPRGRPVEDRSYSYLSSAFLPPKSQDEIAPASDVSVGYLSQGSNFHNCYSKVFCTCGAYVADRDLPSIILRGKEPGGLYRNGCTQRIRACERNLLDGELCCSRKTDEVKDKKNDTELEEGKETGKPLASGAKSFDDLEEKLLVGNRTSRFEYLVHKRKRTIRRRKKLAPSNGKQPLCFPELSVETNCISVKDSAYLCDNPSGVAPRFSKFNAEPKIKTVCPESSGSETYLLEVGGMNDVQKDGESVIETVPMREEAGFVDILSPAGCKMDVENVNIPLISSGMSSAVTIKGLPSEPVRERFIKYTFQRKRKRQALSNTDASANLDTVEKREGKPNCDQKLEPLRSILSNESSRDSRRLAQVARQLISLSEKKWWH